MNVLHTIPRQNIPRSCCGVCSLDHGKGQEIKEFEMDLV